MAAVYDRITAASEAAGVAAWRGELLAGLSGPVIEIGAGTGHNLGHYPEAVEKLVLVEPDRFMRARLEEALATDQFWAGTTVEVSDASAEALPFEAASFDAAVVALVLCSVPSPEAALAEIARVLVPGGQLVFLEHVGADPVERARRRKWQGRLEPIWKRAFGGCHLTRDTEAAIASAGFTIERLERASIRKSVPVCRPSIRGCARAPVDR